MDALGKKGEVPRRAPSLPPLKLLVIEDDVVMARNLMNLLSQEKNPAFEVEETDRLKTSLRSLRRYMPDVILLELHLPDSSGLETFLKVHANAPAVPIVILTSTHDEDLAMQAIKRGADDYLIKENLDLKRIPRLLRFAFERKRAQRRLLLAEARYRTIFENSAVAITVTDAQERIVSWNKCAENLLGMNRQDLYLRPVRSLYPEKEWRSIRLRNIRQKGIQSHFETRVLRKDGEVIDIDIAISVLKDAEGMVTGSIGIMKDITERKRTERALREAEARYRTIFENSAVGITVTDAEERIVSWNKFAEELLKRGPEDLYQKPVSSLYPETEWKRIRSCNIRQKNKPQHLESQMVLKDGSVIDIEVSITVLKDAEGRVTGSIGIIKDITDRKMAEYALQFAELKYRTIFENSAVAITVTDADENIVSWNQFA
ncbi:MAG: PAS domain S-box protein, partial [Candidatus Omnitrophica bacterium]|nr:PAS domain S-box protein [Candidatus Omnitrophota bacterium]